MKAVRENATKLENKNNTLRSNEEALNENYNKEIIMTTKKFKNEIKEIKIKHQKEIHLTTDKFKKKYR